MDMYYDTVQHITTMDTTYIHVSGFIKGIKYQDLNVHEKYCCIPFRVLYSFLSTTYIIDSKYFKEMIILSSFSRVRIPSSALNVSLEGVIF